MTDRGLQWVLRHLPGPAGVPLAGVSDGQLLQRYVAQADETAFTALFTRHAPMVLGVCRRVLHQEQDAEDAFQATFLLLARKAASIRKRESVGSWLYGVARRVAMKARKRVTKEQNREKRAGPEKSTGPGLEAACRELQALLDDALASLPAKYRAAIVLCYLEGRTVNEAARELGCPRGTVASRLAQGRKLLRDRLARRGLALSVGALTTFLLTSTAPAAVPRVLLQPALQAAFAYAAGKTAAAASSTRVAVLVQGVSRTMLWSKAKTVLILVMALGLAVVGTGARVYQTLTAEEPDARSEGGPAPVGGTKAHTDSYGDLLPEGALARLGTVRLRLGGMVTAAALTADGKAIVAAGQDRIVQLFRTTDGREIRQFRAGARTPNFFDAVALAPDGKTLAAGSAWYVVLWDVETGQQLGLLQGHTRLNKINALAFAPDGKLLASASDDTTIGLWDVARRQQLRQLKGHQGRVTVVVFSADGRQLISGGADRTIRLWDVATGKEVRTLHPSASRRSGWEPLTGKPVPAAEGQAAPVLALARSPDGKLLASAGADEIVHLWDLTSFQELRTLAGHDPRYPRMPLLTSVAFSPDGKTVASGDGATIYLWDTATGKERGRLQGHCGPVHFVGFFGAQRLASAGWDHTIRLWDLATGKELLARKGPEGAIEYLAFSPDGRFVATAGEDALVRLWDAVRAREIRRFQPVPNLRGWVKSLAFAPDGQSVAGVANDAVYFWDTATGNVRRMWPENTPNKIACLAFAPDGKTLVTGGWDKLIRVWDVATSQELSRFAGHPSAVYRVAVSPDGKKIASLSGPRSLEPSSVRLWDTATGKELYDLEEAKDCQGGLAFSSDGKILAAGAGMDTVRLWDVETGRPIRVMRATRQNYPVEFPLAFSPDDRTVAVGSFADNTVYLFEVATGGLRTRFSGHRGLVRSLAFSPDGQRLISGSNDTTALVWDVTGRLSAPSRPTPLTTKEIADLWEDLASPDAERAGRAIRLLAGAPTQALPILKRHLVPIKPADTERLAQWIRDLDSATFAVRRQASAELAKVGDAAEPALRRALEGQPSPEAKKRLEQLLSDLKDNSPRRLPLLRALEVLESIGTREARQFLKELAGGASDTWLTRGAQAALKCLSKRPMTSHE